jgi:hypothetical protein
MLPAVDRYLVLAFSADAVKVIPDTSACRFSARCAFAARLQKT